MSEKGEIVALMTKQDLVKIRSRALRTKVWFKALSKVERAIMDLTIKCVERIRSNVLARAISTIVSNLLESLEKGFMTRANRVGYKIAERLCTLGERWGNKACSTWKYDKCFIEFLGVNALNT